MPNGNILDPRNNQERPYGFLLDWGTRGDPKTHTYTYMYVKDEEFRDVNAWTNIKSRQVPALLLVDGELIRLEVHLIIQYLDPRPVQENARKCIRQALIKKPDIDLIQNKEAINKLSDIDLMERRDLMYDEIQKLIPKILE